MRNGYRAKILIKKMGFKELQKECEKHDWEIPFACEIAHIKTDYEDIWVADPLKEQDAVETHSNLYRTTRDSLIMANKNFMEHAIVLVKEGL